mmetsp:Transcript_44213/g.122548  ORF Transcript_44213/g.122548 Transcript_44213/m.122548 type:complete len:471 (+) Transcript_44213:122-1534(+)
MLGRSRGERKWCGDESGPCNPKKSDSQISRGEPRSATRGESLSSGTPRGLASRPRTPSLEPTRCSSSFTEKAPSSIVPSSDAFDEPGRGAPSQSRWPVGRSGPSAKRSSSSSVASSGGAAPAPPLAPAPVALVRRRRLRGGTSPESCCCRWASDFSTRAAQKPWSQSMCFVIRSRCAASASAASAGGFCHATLSSCMCSSSSLAFAWSSAVTPCGSGWVASSRVLSASVAAASAVAVSCTDDLRLLLLAFDAFDALPPLGAPSSVGLASPAPSGPSSMPPSLTPAAAAAAVVAAVMASATAPRCLFASRFSFRSSRRSAEFQRFLIWLSVRPGSIFAISAQRLPRAWCASRSLRSSSTVHSPLLIIGSRWLCHRSRHCLPVRLGSCAAIVDHERVPCSSTRAAILVSSSALHTRRSDDALPQSDRAAAVRSANSGVSAPAISIASSPSIGARVSVSGSGGRGSGASTSMT